MDYFTRKYMTNHNILYDTNNTLLLWMLGTVDLEHYMIWNEYPITPPYGGYCELGIEE